MQERQIPGLQAVVIREGKIVLSTALGMADVAFGVPVKKHTLFSINSIAKAFTATSIMRLAEKGEIDLSGVISNYLPDLPLAWRQVSVLELLSHTSGLPDIEDPNVDQLIGGKGQDSAWSIVQTLPLEFLSGTDFSYNATNYLLLQRLIEKLGGNLFEEKMAQEHFAPFGITNITYGHSYEVVKDKGTTYSYYKLDKGTGEYLKGEQLLEVHETFPSLLRGDAGAFCSAEAMAKWLIALRKDGTLLSKASLEKMWTPLQLADGSYGEYGGPFNAYALGWPIIRRQEHPVVAAFGGGRATIFIYPEDDLSILLFTNLTGSSPHEIAAGIAAFYL